MRESLAISMFEGDLLGQRRRMRRLLSVVGKEKHEGRQYAGYLWVASFKSIIKERKRQDYRLS